jgi:translation initiation factor 2B subunit (eIF-2B alpha/beta/delta family)
MTNVIVAWFDKELGIVKTDISNLDPQIIAWAKNFLSTITPVIKQAAEDAVLAAVTVPGTGAIKAAAALATATADLATKGVPIVENDLKAAIQIAYNALPTSVTSNTAAEAVLGAADSEVTTVAEKVDPAA